MNSHQRERMTQLLDAIERLSNIANINGRLTLISFSGEMLPPQGDYCIKLSDALKLSAAQLAKEAEAELESLMREATA